MIVMQFKVIVSSSFICDVVECMVGSSCSIQDQKMKILIDMVMEQDSVVKVVQIFGLFKSVCIFRQVQIFDVVVSIFSVVELKVFSQFRCCFSLCVQ